MRTKPSRGESRTAAPSQSRRFQQRTFEANSAARAASSSTPYDVSSSDAPAVTVNGSSVMSHTRVWRRSTQDSTAKDSVLVFDYFTEPLKSPSLYWRFGRASTRAAGEPLRLGVDSTTTVA